MQAAKRTKKLASFWIGPLVAGSCLATGYEVTHRVMVLNLSLKEQPISLFHNSNSSLGNELESLNQNHSNPQKTKSPKKESNQFSTMHALEENKIQSLLNALEPNFEGSEIYKQTHQRRPENQLESSHLTPSKIEKIFKMQTFNELLEKLPEP